MMVGMFLITMFLVSLMMCFFLNEYFEDKKEKRKKYEYIVNAKFEQLCKDNFIPDFLNSHAYNQAVFYADELSQNGLIDELYERSLLCNKL